MIKHRKNISKKSRIKVAAFLVIVGLVVYTFRNEFPPIIKEIKKTDKSILLIIAMLGLLYQFFDGLSLRTIAGSLGESSISPFDSWGCSLYSAFYRVISFGSATYLSIIYYFKRKNVDVDKGFSISTINYMAQRFAIVLMAIIMYFLNFDFMKENYGKYRSYLLIGILLTALILLMLCLICVSKKFHKYILCVFKLDKKNRFEDFRLKIEKNLSLIRGSTKGLLCDKILLVKIILLNILKISCWCIIPCIIFYNICDYKIFDYICVSSLALALIGVIPAPGAMGSTEFVFGMLFAVLMKTEVAISGIFLYRFANFIIPTVTGGVVAVILRVQQRKNKKEIK